MLLTKHVQVRMQQRSVRLQDLKLFERFGTEIRDGIILLDRDIDYWITELRQIIERLEKLRGKVLIMDGDYALTTYSPSKRRLKRFLRQRQ
jgi:hypothetical protein